MLRAYTQFVGGGYDHFMWEQAHGHPRAACSYDEWYDKWLNEPDLGDCLSGLAARPAAPDRLPQFEEWYASCYDEWCSQKARELKAEVERKKAEVAQLAELEQDVAATLTNMGEVVNMERVAVAKFNKASQPPKKRKRDGGTKMHVCADGEVKQWVKWGCVACHDKDYCNIPSHLSREGKRPRARDCSKCHPDKNARTRKNLCCHHRAGCEDKSCRGCRRKDHCLECWGCECVGDARKIKHFCPTCSPHMFAQGKHKWKNKHIMAPLVADSEKGETKPDI